MNKMRNVVQIILIFQMVTHFKNSSFIIYSYINIVK